MARNQSVTALVLGLILASACAASQAAFAEDQTALSDDQPDSAIVSGEGAEAIGEQQPSVKISGEETLRTSLPVAGGTADNADLSRASTLDSIVKMEFEKGDIRFVSEWSALTSPGAIKNGNGETTNGIGSESEYLSIEPLENALYYSTSAFKLGLGWQYFSWGVADEINPTDYLNARDFRYGAKDKKIPSFAGSVAWYPSDEWSLEGVIEPRFQASRFGVSWAGQIPDEAFAGGARSVAVDEPSNGAESFTGAFRARYFGSDLDVSASYLYGWDRFYTPEIGVSDHGGAYVIDSVTLERRRIHRFGLDAKCVVGKYGVWAEGAYSMPETAGDSWTRRRPELSWVAGFDFNFGATDEHYANVQYFGTYIPGYDASYHTDYANGLPDAGSYGDQRYMRKYYYRSLVQGLGLQTERLLQGIAGTVELSFLEGRVKPTLDYTGYIPVGYDDAKVTRYGSLILMPKLVLLPIDALRVTIGSEMAWSWIKENGGSVKLDKTDKIGQMTDDNRVYLEIAYSWILP
jgi:hypothetical protein